MTLGTWNIERLKHKNNLQAIYAEVKKVNADILVLTEYDERLELDYPFQVSTKFIESFRNVQYAATERRVKIFSRYEIVQSFKTFNECTSCCVELKTPMRNLIVYGTIIGILGNRDVSFNEDLAFQIEDFKRFGNGQHLCIMGDYNISFNDHYYFTLHGRNELTNVFTSIKMQNLTADIPNNIDHIAVSRTFLNDLSFTNGFWNAATSKANPLLSDHMGVWVNISKIFH